MDDYVDHVDDYYDKKKPFACSKCDISYNVASDLQKHLLAGHHEGKKDFQCDKCDKNYEHVHYAHRSTL